mgnify:FL=1
MACVARKQCPYKFFKGFTTSSTSPSTPEAPRSTAVLYPPDDVAKEVCSFMSTRFTPMTVAEIIDAFVPSPNPFRWEAFDGSATGPVDAQFTVKINSL